MGRKLGDVPFLGGAGSPSNTVAWAVAYLHSKWHLNPSSHLAATDMGRKLGGSDPFGERELGLPPSNAMWTGLRPICMPSLIFVVPTVWPQCTNVPDRQDRADRHTGQRSDSIGRTVLQTVAQKVGADCEPCWCCTMSGFVLSASGDRQCEFTAGIKITSGQSNLT